MCIPDDDTLGPARVHKSHPHSRCLSEKPVRGPSFVAWEHKGKGSVCCPLLQVGNYVSAARVLELMQGEGLSPTVQAYTSYMDACVKANTATSLARAFQVLQATKSIQCLPAIQALLRGQMEP